MEDSCRMLRLRTPNDFLDGVIALCVCMTLRVWLPPAAVTERVTRRFVYTAVLFNFFCLPLGLVRLLTMTSAELRLFFEKKYNHPGGEKNLRA